MDLVSPPVLIHSLYGTHEEKLCLPGRGKAKWLLSWVVNKSMLIFLVCVCDFCVLTLIALFGFVAREVWIY